MKKAYQNNPELNAERESLNISEQELNISKSSYLPTVTLSGSKSEEDTEKLTDRSGADTTITDVDPTVKSITITQTLIDFGRGAELAKSKIGINLNNNLGRKIQRSSQVGGTEERISLRESQSNIKDQTK